MEQFFVGLFGVDSNISAAQESARTILIFCYGLLLLRVSGPRMFGRWSALDIVVTIMVGSALARTMTGGAPLVGTLVSAAIVVCLHVGLGHAVARSSKLARLFEGMAVILVDHGRIDHAARKRYMISEADLLEALRQRGVDGEAHIDNVKVMRLEPSGQLSVVKVEPCRVDRG
jgi:uncharacterized membrane protein YcaP (DUF421 family)